MASKTSLTATFEQLPKIAKLLLIAFFGWIVGGIYRIIRYTENQNTTTLVVGIIGVIPPFGFILWATDLVSEFLHDKITILAD